MQSLRFVRLKLTTFLQDNTWNLI